MDSLKTKALSLRASGKSYTEICSLIGVEIPKSTLSYWCRNIKLPIHQLSRIEKKVAKAGLKGLAIAHARRRIERKLYLESLHVKNSHLSKLVRKDFNYAKVILVALYLAEGGKNRKGSLMFGNSNPRIISLFLLLLRQVYEIDDTKFRCTLLCRADQNTQKLKSFWRSVTGISEKQFYSSRIDSRTIGKKSRNPNYKGVCRIDYFSAHVYNDLIAAGNVLTSFK